MSKAFKCNFCNDLKEGKPRATLKLHERLGELITFQNKDVELRKADVCERCLKNKFGIEKKEKVEE